MARPLKAPPPEPKPGDSVGDFVLRGLIAESRLGTQYAAFRTRDALPCALRIVRAEVAGTTELWNAFVATSTAVWKHDRRHIAPVVGSGRFEDGGAWIAYALAENRTLAQLLEEHPLEPAELLSMLRGVCRSLEAAHKHGIFHGDLTPASVCISNDSDGRMRARLLGLGSAALLDGGRSRSGPVARDGSAYPAFDASRDLRAIGSLCFEALSGEAFPDDGSDEPPRVSDVRPELGPHFDETVHSLLVVSEQPASAADAYGQMVAAARKAGYDVGSAIPPAPRSSRDAIAAARTSQGADPPKHASSKNSRVGPVLLVLALLVLLAVLAKTQF